MILFANDTADALNFCTEAGYEFDEIHWFRSLAFVDPKLLVGVERDDVSTTPAFRDSPAYPAVFKWVATL